MLILYVYYFRFTSVFTKITIFFRHLTIIQQEKKEPISSSFIGLAWMEIRINTLYGSASI